ncbi:energy transducer TonB family protein [Belnapia rosea]|uniref:Outer membrane transport energization protein TonB n=1 Tax=Belnapia rosea TaxID=938405 RepID=A0A1G6MCR4_9PROT|nr:energy transducer TonB [Belnapia rosea]SDC53388.1 outer membrane transport energization protein TonB [Belnapia rosea]
MAQARHIAWAISLGLHAAGATALLHGLPAEPEVVTPVMLVEMPEPAAPEPEAEPPPEPVAEAPPPQPAPPPEPPPPEPVAMAEPPPPEPMAPEPPPQAEPPPPEPPPPAEVAELPMPPPPPPPEPAPKPVVQPRRPPPPPRPATPTIAEAPPAPAAPAAPAPTAAPVASAPPPSYTAMLMRALERHRRYPDEARWRHAQGVALLRFRMKRDGTVVGYRIERSAGDPALDQAVQTMIQNASPLPAPPAEMSGDPVELTVPVRFSLR